ncbi:hypothetical protein [Chondromyces crocatus]|uniref:Uncharacterized protein n=1 Tax=Chondromyces crocatus TaxID=52 RepID=A0A0K1ENV8_CHOCO|nr:hypothetical protein [Chondromyces crocatus]AKT42509.1 uncharacterized protein CMC5_067350 [Chondromyces crocatus]
MNEQPQRIDIHGAVPIPVGHDVEVWYLRAARGGLYADVEGPMVRQLSTGILYGPSWAYRDEGGVIYESAPPDLQLHGKVKITSNWTGRVVHCRIVTTGSKRVGEITTLLVQRHTAAPPYR